ncbi:SH3 domain-containing protein [Devosia sp.]|uniref:SH3 domain-containing protein n=1 Tax=Devosia sp. TaxID=1871048 RepID=UPI002EF38F7B
MLRVIIPAALGAAALLCMGTAALAVDAVATAGVNVRTGPGTGYSIVDQLIRGELVNIRECSSNNWCFVEHDGPDGWVSAAYLTAAPDFEDEAPPPAAPGEDCSFGFVIGPGGPSLSIQCGDQPVPPPAPPAPPPPAGDRACFYTGSNYSGTERCYGVSTRNSLPAVIDDRISSVRLFGDVEAQLCVNQNLGGACRIIDTNTPSLPPVINDRASSLRVYLPEPPPPPAEACFYTGTNYNGTERCFGVGVRNSLPAAINDRISSVRLSGGARARLCVNQNLGGFCRLVNNDNPSLGPQINDRASSLEVFTGPAPLPPPPVPEAPVTFSTGSIALQQTFTANLDNGTVGAAGADIWYQAVNAAEKYVTPRNGAQLALGDRSNRGYAGCSTESYSNASIPLWDMPPGSYVCVRTNQGRISQFRLNGFTGTTMNLGYTTWAN